MNTWNDFKAIQPKTNWPINPVFVTDGEKVWFGRLSIWRRSLMFTGCSLQSGELEQFHTCKLTGWQPAPDTFGKDINAPITDVPEIDVGKSADEMFSDLGFRKNTSVCYGEDKGLVCYEKPVAGDTDCLRIFFHEYDVCYYNLAHRALWTQYGVVAAIKKKMEELGWDSENS